jgi:hypothetical protein
MDRRSGRSRRSSLQFEAKTRLLRAMTSDSSSASRCRAMLPPPSAGISIGTPPGADHIFAARSSSSDTRAPAAPASEIAEEEKSGAIPRMRPFLRGICGHPSVGPLIPITDQASLEIHREGRQGFDWQSRQHIMCDDGNSFVPSEDIAGPSRRDNPIRTASRCPLIDQKSSHHRK